MELRVRPKVDYLTESEIEDIATELLELYQETEGEIQNPPIPIEFIVEDFLQFKVLWEVFQESDTLAYIDPNEKKICFNLEKADYFDRVGSEFTMAHEIGHFKLDHFEDVSKQLALGILDQPTRFLHRDNAGSTYSRHEFQAEYFASCLLMPKWLISTVQRKYDLLKWHNLYTIADLFNVSITALTKRLSRLRLIYIKDKKIYTSEQDASGMSRLL